jgi:hypothetical protein
VNVIASYKAPTAHTTSVSAIRSATLLTHLMSGCLRVELHLNLPIGVSNKLVVLCISTDECYVNTSVILFKALLTKVLQFVTVYSSNGSFFTMTLILSASSVSTNIFTSLYI